MNRRIVNLACGVLLACSAGTATASDRFGRHVHEVVDKQSYQFFRLDDTNFPYLQRNSATVSCIAYQGYENYYVEVSITNTSNHTLVLNDRSIALSVPGYTTFRTNTLDVARDAAQEAGVAFQPAPPPVVGTTTTFNATEVSTSYGTSRMSGTTTTGPSAQQGAANLGNAIGNLIAASQFASNQSEEARFAKFLSTFAIEAQSGPIQPGETKCVVETFEQVKQAQRPFAVTVHAGEEDFVFNFRDR